MAYLVRLDAGLAAKLPTAARDAWRVVNGSPAAVVFAASRSTDVGTVDVPDFGRVVRKRWTWPTRRDRVKGAFRTTWAARSPARRESEALARLCGLPQGPFAPAPLGFLERRERGVLRACVLVEREIVGATDLATWLVSSKPGPARAQLMERLASRVREMHDVGLVDFEMHPRNVLVVPTTGEVFKVDCAKQRVRTRPASTSDRARDLAALDVGLTRLATASERAKFLEVYGAGDELVAAVGRERERIDAREAKRLPR